jgi:hypothetical protein
MVDDLRPLAPARMRARVRPPMSGQRSAARGALLAGIDLNKARNRHVVDAVVELSTKPDGFTLAQLTEAVKQRSGQDATYSARNAAYDVAKLVGRALLRRIERSRRYAVDPPGVRILCAYLLLREKIIKPILAGVARPEGRPPKVAAPFGSTLVRCAKN